MQRLSAEKILAVWEAGRSQHALDRSLTIIAAASPGASRAALADLSIGERDARLLQLRALVLGPRAEGFAECPRLRRAGRISTRYRATFAEGRASARPPGVPALHETETNGNRISFRLPTSRDLAEAVAASDSSLALRALVERCAGQADLPNETVEAVSRVMLAADPTAEITLRLFVRLVTIVGNCFSILREFFWTEIAAQAQRLLREIDALARAYGWTEREILSLPAQRRQAYLELVAA